MKTLLPNPKSEVRNPGERRNPNPESSWTQRGGGSGFGLRVSFGFRPSIFGLTATALCLVLAFFCLPARSQTTAFTYQGQLLENSQPANGTYDLVFSLYDTPTNGNFLALFSPGSISITNGLFTTQLDFGTNLFTGQPLWLQIEAKSTSDTVSDLLSPRQRLTPTPYAVHALTVEATGLRGAIPSTNFAPGTLDGRVLADDSVSSLKMLDGTILPVDLDAASFNGTFWKADGNTGTTPGAQFIGTTDNQPLEFKANGTRSLRIEPNTNGAPNMIGGAPVNSVDPGVAGATIAGGGARWWSGAFLFGSGTNHVSGDFGAIGGGLQNRVEAEYGVIGGGGKNTIQSNASFAAIAGGTYNVIEPNASGASIGGGDSNTIEANASDATISGGRSSRIVKEASDATIGGGNRNLIRAFSLGATIGGGAGNTIQSNANSASIAGGYYNRIEDNAARATIGGGADNTIVTNAEAATISGGSANTVSGSYAVVSGGRINEASNRGATVSGGEANTASGFRGTVGGGVSNQASGDYAVVPGGANNEATGDYSFAGGLRAKANHDGCFVWGDTVNADLASTGPNQFLVRATGGMTVRAGNSQAARLSLGSSGSPAWEMAVPAATEPTLQFNHGSSTAMSVSYFGTVTAIAFNPTSDRNAKEHFESIEPEAILNRVLSLPISRWNFKEETHVQHVGPMAQDFRAAFGLGTDDKHIATVDADGVALAAIQGLNQKLTEELKLRDKENAKLNERLARLERLIAHQSKKGQQP